jgi:hypothetical protein
MATDETSVVLEQYKLVVEMADRVSARRAGANTFFLTLNTALASAFGIVSAARKTTGQNDSFDAFGIIVTAVAGIVLALVWWALLRYYRRLNGAKFDVINKIEDRLPVKPYTDEWAILHPGEPETEGERAKLSWMRRVKHREATVVEQVVPWVFVVLYIILGVRAVIQ